MTLQGIEPEDRMKGHLEFELAGCVDLAVPGADARVNVDGNIEILFNLESEPQDSQCQVLVLHPSPTRDASITWHHPEVGVMYHAKGLPIVKTSRQRGVSRAPCQKTYSMRVGTSQPTFLLTASIQFPVDRPQSGLISARLRCAPNLIGSSLLTPSGTRGGRFAFEYGFDPGATSFDCTELEVFHDGSFAFVGSIHDGISEVALPHRSLRIEKANSSTPVSDRPIELVPVRPILASRGIVQTREAPECTSGLLDLEVRECLPP